MAGRDLAVLHIDYEAVEPWPELTDAYATGFDAEHPNAYRVLKMRHPKVADPLAPNSAKVDDRSRIIFNDWINDWGHPGTGPRLRTWLTVGDRLGDGVEPGPH